METKVIKYIRDIAKNFQTNMTTQLNAMGMGQQVLFNCTVNNADIIDTPLDFEFISGAFQVEYKEDAQNFGSCYIVTPRNVAILFHGMMMGRPLDSIQDDMQYTRLNEETADGFGEVTNLFLPTITDISQRANKKECHYVLSNTMDFDEYLTFANIYELIKDGTIITAPIDIRYMDQIETTIYLVFSETYIKNVLELWEDDEDPTELGELPELPKLPGQDDEKDEPFSQFYEDTMNQVTEVIRKLPGSALSALECFNDPHSVEKYMEDPKSWERVSRSIKVAEIYKIFKNNAESDLVYCVDEEGTLLRTFSKEDLREAMGVFWRKQHITLREKAVLGRRLDEVNTRNTIKEALYKMYAHRLRKIPVIDPNTGKVKGMFSMFNWIQAVVGSFHSKRRLNKKAQ